MCHATGGTVLDFHLCDNEYISMWRECRNKAHGPRLANLVKNASLFNMFLMFGLKFCECMTL